MRQGGSGRLLLPVVGCLEALLHVGGGRQSVKLLEGGREVVDVGKSRTRRHLVDALPLGCQEGGSLLEADVADEVARRLVGQFLELAVEVDTADADLLGKHVDAQVRVRHVVVDDLHHAVEQAFVGRLHVELLHALLLCLAAAELVLQQLPVVDEVLHGPPQDFDAEGLRQVGVGAAVQPLQVVLLARLGGQQDHGDVVEVDVLLDACAQGDAVHLGHHHVADDEVGRTLEDEFERLLAVAAPLGVEVGSELAADVAADFLVVLDHEHPVAALRVDCLPLGAGVGVGLWRRAGCRADGDSRGEGSVQLVGCEVAAAQRKADGEVAACPVGVVGCLDGAVVETDERARQVKPHAGAGLGLVAGVVHLVEAVEDAADF